MINHQQGQGSASCGSHIGSEEDLRAAKAAIQEKKAAIQDYERRRAEVRGVLRDVLAAECASEDGLLTEMLSEGYRERTGKAVEPVTVSDFLSEIADQLALPEPKKPSKPKRKTGPRPVAVIGADGDERPVSGGWIGVFRMLAREIADDNPGREDIWRDLPFVQSNLPDYVKNIKANVQVAPGLWLNTNGDAEATQDKTRVMLKAFDYPLSRWRLQLRDGTTWKF